MKKLGRSIAPLAMLAGQLFRNPHRPCRSKLKAFFLKSSDYFTGQVPPHITWLDDY
jgi:hypothetical protein